MKKKLVFIALLILLFPIPMRLRDGGTVVYKSLLYQVYDVNSLNEWCSSGYSEGIIVELFGKRVYENVSCDIIDRSYEVLGVSMKVKDNTLTNTGMVVIIEDLNDEKYTYGELFHIEKKEGDKWVELTPITDDYGFNEIGYLVGDDNTLEMKQEWFNIYGYLYSGKYRLVKNVYNDSEILFFSVEFEL